MKSTSKKKNTQLNHELSSEEIIAIGNQAYQEATAVTWRQAEVGRTLTQNDKIALTDDKTLVIGAFDSRGREFSKKVLEFYNNEAGFEKAKAWILMIRDERHMEKVVVGMEPTGHYWFNPASWLMNAGITVVLVNPHHVKKSKELDDNLNRKTDRKDPKVIAGLVHKGRYSMPYLPEGLYAELRNLANLRFMNTEEKTRTMNRIKRWLPIYFPEYTTVFKSVVGAGSLLLLEKAALPEDILKLGAFGINQIWRGAKLRGTGYAKAYQILTAVQHSIGRTEGLNMARNEILWLTERLKGLTGWEGKLLAQLEELSTELPFIGNILEIKGLGIRTVTGILAEIGDITRFTEARQIQKLAGLALVEDSSGKHEGKTIISKWGRKRLRYQLYQAALVLIGQNAKFRQVYEYYITRDRNPLKKMQALMAVACKLLRIPYAMVTKGAKYDTVKMLEDIKRPEKQAA